MEWSYADGSEIGGAQTPDPLKSWEDRHWYLCSDVLC